jgi:hypothetical protein
LLQLTKARHGTANIIGPLGTFRTKRATGLS